MRIGDAAPESRRPARPARRVACPACDARAASFFLVERGWVFVRCRRCATVYLNPRPGLAAVREHYRDYLSPDPERIREWEASQRPLVRRAVSRLRRRLDPGERVLDAGCGYGFLAAEMRQAGFQAEGVEISPTGIAHARSLGVAVTAGTLEEAAFEAGRFGAVTAFYVIEHLENPRDFLREAWRVLRPGGTLILRWPHTAPLVRWCRLFGLGFDLFDAPSHLTDFTPASLEALLARCGFREVETRPGGSTRAPETVARIAGVLGAALGDALYAVSLGRYVAPGASKTTIARR